MITLKEDLIKIEENPNNLTYITIPFDEDFPLLKMNFDVDNEVVMVGEQKYRVDDCLVSDNGEWINLVCYKMQHGGPRPNSGRPVTDRKIAISVRISPEAYEKWKSVPNKSEFIDTLIKQSL